MKLFKILLFQNMKDKRRRGRIVEGVLMAENEDDAIEKFEKHIGIIDYTRESTTAEERNSRDSFWTVSAYEVEDGILIVKR